MSGIGKPKPKYFNKDRKTKTSWLQMLSPQKYYKNQWKRNYIAEKKTQDMNRTKKKQTNVLAIARSKENDKKELMPFFNIDQWNKR